MKFFWFRPAGDVVHHMLLGKSRNAFEGIWQKFWSYSCCNCEWISVSEESEQATFIHGTYAFNAWCSPRTNPKTSWRISLEPKGSQFFLLMVHLKHFELYIRAIAWRIWLCWNTVREGKKKAHQYCQNSEVFCSSWLSAKLVHWFKLKPWRGFLLTGLEGHTGNTVHSHLMLH